jgi:NADH-quinone oxidoreductase subunit M
VCLFAHSLCTAGLLAITALIERRTGSTDLDRLGGLWARAPRLTFIAVFFAMAAVGLPGLGTFTAQILLVIGTFPKAPIWASIAEGAVVLATLTSLGVLHRAFIGMPTDADMGDVDGRESVLLLALMAGLLALGLYPQPLLDAVDPTVAAIVEGATP